MTAELSMRPVEISTIVRYTRPRWRAGNMGAEGAAPSNLPIQLVHFSLIWPIA